MLFKVYVIYAPAHDKLFTGMTTGLGDRMEVHNGSGTSDWTSEYRPWTLVHMELFDNDDEATLRESYLKSREGEQFLRANVLSLFNFS